MKAILILAGPYSTCDATKIIWQDLFGKNNIDFETVNLSTDQGREIASKLNINSFPALVVDNKVIAVGHPNEQSAQKVFETLEKQLNV